MIFDFDDFGANHVISDACQSHDCRKQLDALHYANPNFKVTLFAIPAEMTMELLEWCQANNSWIELAYHGFYHSSNYECEKMTYDQFEELMHYAVTHRVARFFVKGFKAPGWQISEGIYKWLADNGWWVADQAYNNHRRPFDIPAYVNNNGNFSVMRGGQTVYSPVEAWHGHCWSTMGNGIQETYDQVETLVRNAKSFEFVSEVLK